MTEFLAAAGWRTHFCLGGATAERHVRHRLAPTCVRVPDLDFIRKHPVDFIQGYLIRKKSPLPELLAALPTLAGSIDTCPAQPAAA
jgi:hypothetical protein